MPEPAEELDSGLIRFKAVTFQRMAGKYKLYNTEEYDVTDLQQDVVDFSCADEKQIQCPVHCSRNEYARKELKILTEQAA